MSNLLCLFFYSEYDWLKWARTKNTTFPITCYTYLYFLNFLSRNQETWLLCAKWMCNKHKLNWFCWHICSRPAICDSCADRRLQPYRSYRLFLLILLTFIMIPNLNLLILCWAYFLKLLCVWLQLFDICKIVNIWKVNNGRGN